MAESICQRNMDLLRKQVLRSALPSAPQEDHQGQVCWRSASKEEHQTSRWCHDAGSPLQVVAPVLVSSKREGGEQGVRRGHGQSCHALAADHVCRWRRCGRKRRCTSPHHKETRDRMPNDQFRTSIKPRCQPRGLCWQLRPRPARRGSPEGPCLGVVQDASGVHPSMLVLQEQNHKVHSCWRLTSRELSVSKLLI